MKDTLNLGRWWPQALYSAVILVGAVALGEAGVGPIPTNDVGVSVYLLFVVGLAIGHAARRPRHGAPTGDRGARRWPAPVTWLLRAAAVAL